MHIRDIPVSSAIKVLDYVNFHGIRVSIHRDEFRRLTTEFYEDEVIHMFMYHRKYAFGKKAYGDHSVANGAFQAFLAEAPKGTAHAQVYLYDHSGLSVRIGGPQDRWDSSMIGWVAVTPDMALPGKTPEETIKIRVEEWDDILTGMTTAYDVLVEHRDGSRAWVLNLTARSFDFPVDDIVAAVAEQVPPSVVEPLGGRGTAEDIARRTVADAIKALA